MLQMPTTQSKRCDEASCNRIAMFREVQKRNVYEAHVCPDHRDGFRTYVSVHTTEHPKCEEPTCYAHAERCRRHPIATLLVHSEQPIAIGYGT